MDRRPARAVLVAVAASLASFATVACDPADSSATSDALRLRFDDAGAVGDAVWTTTNQGRAAVQVGVATADGGRARAERSRTGDGRSLRLPAFDPWAPAPRAVLTVVPAGTGDGLDPGTRSFEFGADVALDATTALVASGSVDDGDNLVQRGLWNDPAQWKLELDRHRPSCRIKGRSGTVSVTASIALEAGRWYRVRCRRTADVVELAVSSWRTDGTLETRRWTATGATGDLRPRTPTTPVAVGGKVVDARSLDPGTDQCNGRIDEVVVRIG